MDYMFSLKFEEGNWGGGLSFHLRSDLSGKWFPGFISVLDALMDSLGVKFHIHLNIDIPISHE